MMERRLDKRFYRLAYEDGAGLSDQQLLAAVGQMPRNRPLNPTEFIQDALARKLIPEDFDPLGFRVHNRELWGGTKADWEIAIHFLRGEHSDPTHWRRPFDPGFYRQLYLPDLPPSDDATPQRHGAAHPDAYWSLDEALVRNGWRDKAWIAAFGGRYAEYNMLTDRLRTPTQELVHFVETGWRDRLALTADHEFDLTYYSDFIGSTIVMDPAEAYRLWVENGFASGAPANAQAHLRQLGLRLARYPEGFDWQGYLVENPGAAAFALAAQRKPNRWDALEHLVEHGLSSLAKPPPVHGDLLQDLLLIAGDRFAVSVKFDHATQCYERALLNRTPSKELLQHAGDHALRSSRPARALSCYRSARAAGAEGLWTFCNAAKAALALGAFDEATEWTLAGLQRFPCNTHLLNEFLQIQHARYNCTCERHAAGLKAGRTTTGIDADLDVILAQFRNARAACFGSAPPRPLRRHDGLLRVVMLANRDLPQCRFYRVDLKADQLATAPGVQLRVFDRSEHEEFRSAATTADIAIFYRVASTVDVLRGIADCQSMGVPTVYETDDFVFDATVFPDSLESYAGAISPEEHLDLRTGVALVRHAITACDAAIASTQALAQRLRPLVRANIALVHRNGLSKSLGAIARAHAPSPPPADAPVTLFYGSNTRAHGADFRDLLVPALTSLMTEFPRVRFVACGHVDATALAAQFPNRVDIVAPIQDRDAYLSQFLSVDINLAVIAPTAFNHCKSEIKWLEAAAFGVPSVVSDVAGFGETLADGVDVIRVQPDPRAWLSALRLLVQDPTRRRALGAAARQRARGYYDIETLGASLLAGLRQVADTLIGPAPDGSQPRAAGTPATVPARPRRPRILLCNVLFPPQARGGATRVVRDQAAEMIARYSSSHEVGILAGSDEETPPYTIEAYDWRGAPVWSIGCPFRPHMDWISHDPAMAAPIDAILDRFQPDLLHAHCIQRLTATVLERAAARPIPYVVTVHDGWWISDHQFFTDDRNRLRMPWDPEQYESEANPHTRTESWGRRMRLRGVLDGAEAVIAVSEPFAGIYRRAGVGRVVAVPNGLSALPALVPVPPRPGRVRLAYLGGVAAHKGYFLLRGAFCRGRFANIDLLIADHSMVAGQVREEIWGSTPVRCIGLMPQDQIGKLYGMFDVLLAPSLWPESFGLVAREAMHYGKWILATSLGSIGSDIVPGENGWILDPTEPEALPDILAAIAANPGKYTQPPALRGRLRTVAEQVDELMILYDRILCPGTETSDRTLPAALSQATINSRSSTKHSLHPGAPRPFPPARHPAKAPDIGLDGREPENRAAARVSSGTRRPIMARS